MNIRKIGDLEVKGALSGTENVLVEDGGYAKRVPISAIGGSAAQQLDPHAFGIPVLEMTGDIAAMDKDNAVTLSYVYGERKGTLTCKWQGSSSIGYPKKNYKVTFDTTFEAKSGWGSHNKYVLKANWVDASALRNVFSAKLWGQMVKERSVVDARLSALPNGGATDGFPIWVTINGESMGLYTFTIPKDAWMFGMTGSNAAEGFVCAGDCTLGAPVTGEYSEETWSYDVEVEYAAGDKAALLASLNNMISVLNSVNSADDLTSLEAVVDVQSVIDYSVFLNLVCHDDGVRRNYILATYDGEKWFMSAYDMDATFGNEAVPAGAGYGWASDWSSFYDELADNKLISVVRKYYATQIKERYKNMRGWTWGDMNFQNTLYKTAIVYPKVLINEDMRLWPSRPGTLTNNIHQIEEYMRLRFQTLDWNVESNG